MSPASATAAAVAALIVVVGACVASETLAATWALARSLHGADLAAVALDMPPLGQRTFHPDLFWAVVVFSLVLFCTVGLRPVSCNSDHGFLCREQTDEWKGWMQVVLLLYHYFGVPWLYKPARLIVSAYVVLTAFGNTSYYLSTRDVTVARLCRVALRVSLLPVLLSLALNQPFMLYYVVPQSMLTSAIAWGFAKLAQVLQQRWHASPAIAAYVSLAAIAVACYIVWDTHSSSVLLSSLGLSPVGSGGGEVWLLPGGAAGPSAFSPRHEWVFRTALDHYAPVWGIALAVTAQHARCGAPSSVPSLSPWVAWMVLAAALLSWVTAVLPLPKLEFNALHPYFSIVPITAYVLLRNAHPALRAVYSAPAAIIGKYTLETYLLQHHLWLTSNAKQNLTYIPWPICNFVVASLVFALACYISRHASDVVCTAVFDLVRRCYRTAATAIKAIPVTTRTSAAYATICALCALFWWYPLESFPLPSTLLTVIVAIAIPFILIPTHIRNTSLTCVVAIASLLLSLMALPWLTGSDIITPGTTTTSQLLAPAALRGWLSVSATDYHHSNISIPNSASCVASLLSDHRWHAHGHAQLPITWLWSRVSVLSCSPCVLSTTAMRREAFIHRTTLFVGDSHVRNLFRLAVVELVARGKRGRGDDDVVCTLDGERLDDCDHLTSLAFVGHKNFNVTIAPGNSDSNSSNTVLTFMWAPFSANISSVLQSVDALSYPHTLIVGIGAWDILHTPSFDAAVDATASGVVHALRDYHQRIHTHAHHKICPCGNGEAYDDISTRVVWVTVPPVVPRRLPSPEKRERMTNAGIDRWNDAIERAIAQASAGDVFAAPMPAITLFPMHEAFTSSDFASYDGVHYTDIEYTAVLQWLSHALHCSHVHSLTRNANTCATSTVHGIVNTSASSPSIVKPSMIPGDATLGIAGLACIALLCGVLRVLVPSLCFPLQK